MEDTRTLREIWMSLSKADKSTLTVKVLQMTYAATSTWQAWRVGHRRPAVMEQMAISKALKSTLKIDASIETLFPA